MESGKIENDNRHDMINLANECENEIIKFKTSSKAQHMLRDYLSLTLLERKSLNLTFK